jgi:hypothetical protein
MSSFFNRKAEEVIKMPSTCAPASPDTQIDAVAAEALAKLVNTKFVLAGDGVTSDEMRVFAAFHKSHGDTLYGITPMPSHAHHDAWRAPSGVVYSLKASGAIAGVDGKGSDIVPTSLGDGIAIVEVTARDGSSLSEGYFLQRAATLRNLSTGAAFDGEVSETSLDTPETLPVALHGGSSRVTLHSGYRNNAVRYFLVARAGAGNAAVQLAERARANKYKDFSTLVASADYRVALDIASRRRRAVLAYAASLLELDVATDVDKKSGFVLGASLRSAPNLT